MVTLMKYSSNYSKMEIFLKVVTVSIFFSLHNLGGYRKKWIARYSSDSTKITLCDQGIFLVEHLFYVVRNVHRRNKENIHSDVQNIKCRLR